MLSKLNKIYLNSFIKKFSFLNRSQGDSPSNPIDIVIGASRYKAYEYRIMARKYNKSLYKKVKNDLEEFIRLCPWESEVLYNYARFAKSGIVEIGRYNGGSAMLFSMSNPNVKIHSIDIAPKDDEKLKSLFKKYKCGKNVELIIDDANKYVKNFIKNKTSFDLLFIDGDHSFEGCFNDIKNWYPLLDPGGIIVFHDAGAFKKSKGGGPSPVVEAIYTYCKQDNMNFIVPPNLTDRFWENPYGCFCIGIKPLKT